MPRKAKSDDTGTREEIEASLTQGAGRTKAKKGTSSSATRGVAWISSGSDLMDEVVGGGRGLGYETGMSVLFEAMSSAGKSFLAHEVIASAYHKYKEKCKWLYLDVESGCTFDSKQLYGVEIMPVNVEDRKRPETIEDCFSEIMLFGETIKEGEIGIAVVDSIDGLLSEETETAADERVKNYKKGSDKNDGLRGQQKALFLSRIFWPKINSMIEKKNILLIVVSQYRQAAGQYGPRNTISNGEAIKFYVHARVKFRKVNEIEVSGRPIGAVVEVSTVKLKGPRPYRSCPFILYYSRGVDNIETSIDYLYDLRTAKECDFKKGSEEKLLKFEDVELNRHDLIRHIEQGKLESKLKRMVLDKWEDEEDAAMKPLEGRKSRYA